MLKIVPLETNLISETVKLVMEKASHNGKDTIIIIPTRRMQYFILDEIARVEGKAFISPLIFTIDDFFQYLYLKESPSSVKIDEIEASLSIYEIVKENIPELFSGRDNFVDFFPWALQILNAVESIISEAENTTPPFEQYREFVNLGEYESNYKRLIEKLPIIAEKFMEKLKNEKKHTRGMTYRIVSEKIVNSNVPFGVAPDEYNVFITGFHSLSNTEKKIFRFLLKRYNATLMVRTDIASMNNPRSPFYLQNEMLRELGFKAYEDTKSNSSSISDWECKSEIDIYEAPDMETQVVAAGNIVEKLYSHKYKSKSEKDLKKIAIVLPDPSSMIPVIHHIVSRVKDVPFNISLQYPFARTPLFQLLDSVLKLAENTSDGKFRSMDYLEIIRHPYVKLSRMDSIQLLQTGIHLIETTIARNNTIRTDKNSIIEDINKSEDKEKFDEPDREQIENSIDILAEINDVFILPPNLGLKKTVTFLKNILIFLARFGSEHPLLKQYSALAFEALDELEKFLIKYKNIASNDFNRTASFIRYFLKQKKVPFEGSPLKGIQVIGMLETRGLSFDDVFILDVLEGTLPENRKLDSILPYDIKKIFGMRDYLQWEKLFGYNFFTLIGNSKEARIFYPRKKAGQETSRSRFIEYLIYSYEKKTNRIFQITHITTRFKPSPINTVEVEKDNDIINKLLNIEYSPSSLLRYLKCPMQFYYEKIIGLYEREELAEKIESADWGQIVHDIMKELITKDYSKETIIKLVNKYFKEYGFNPERGVGKIKAWNMAMKLQEPVKSEFERIKNNGIDSIQTEKTLRAALNYNNTSIQLKGTIDRIDKKRNTTTIIDYKTGTSFLTVNPRITPDSIGKILQTCRVSDNLFSLHETITAKLPGFQILFYIFLYLTSEQRESIPDGFFFLFSKSNKIPLDSPSPYLMPVLYNLTDNEKLNVINTFKEILLLIIGEILSRDISFFQTNKRDTCDICPYLYLCKGK